MYNQRGDGYVDIIRRIRTVFVPTIYVGFVSLETSGREKSEQNDGMKDEKPTVVHPCRGSLCAANPDRLHVYDNTRAYNVNV